MFLCSRAANADDVETMLRLCHPEARHTPERRALMCDRWRLWQTSRLQGVVMDDLHPRDGAKAVAIIVGAFVPPALTDRLLGQPQSLIDGLAAALEGRRSPWPDDKTIGQRNMDGGLDLLNLWVGYVDEGLSPIAAADLRSRTLFAFADAMAGQNIHRFIVETDDEAIHTRALAYGAAPSRRQDGTSVLIIDQEGALSQQSVWMLRLFAYEPPILGFSPAQKAILLLAQQGYTDQEIAREVGKSQDSVKKRWTGIYARFNDVFPGRLPVAGNLARGTEKRRTLLYYLKDRPEELRPYGSG